jgi:hypothetical protein
MLTILANSRFLFLKCRLEETSSEKKKYQEVMKRKEMEIAEYTQRYATWVVQVKERQPDVR